MPSNGLSVPLDERRVVDYIAAQVAGVLHRMDSGFSHARLAELLRERLRANDWAVTTKAIEAAERNGDWLADAVCRRTFAEMSNARQPISHQLQAFGQRAVLRPPVTRGRGRDEYSVWSRNIGLCTLIISTCCEFGVRPTRSRSGRHSHPSGVSLVRTALARNGVHIDERTIQDKIWLGLPGTLVRAAFGENLIP